MRHKPSQRLSTLQPVWWSLLQVQHWTGQAGTTCGPQGTCGPLGLIMRSVTTFGNLFFFKFWLLVVQLYRRQKIFEPCYADAYVGVTHAVREAWNTSLLFYEPGAFWEYLFHVQSSNTSLLPKWKYISLKFLGRLREAQIFLSTQLFFVFLRRVIKNNYN
jgi:hypothetical protein